VTVGEPIGPKRANRCRWSQNRPVDRSRPRPFPSRGHSWPGTSRLAKLFKRATGTAPADVVAQMPP
jgi:hypothetical protein